MTGLSNQQPNLTDGMICYNFLSMVGQFTCEPTPSAAPDKHSVYSDNQGNTVSLLFIRALFTAVTEETLSLVFGDEFLAQGLHLK